MVDCHFVVIMEPKYSQQEGMTNKFNQRPRSFNDRLYMRFRSPFQGVFDDWFNK